MINITQLIISIAGILIMILTIYVYPYLKANVNSEQWRMLQNIVYVAVNAAEQLGITQKIDNKFDFAMEQIEKELKKVNLVFDKETIRTAIEAAVRQNFPKK